MSKLWEGMQELSARLEAIKATAEAVDAGAHVAQEKLTSVLRDAEDGGKWKETLEEVFDLQMQLATRIQERADLGSQVAQLQESLRAKEMAFSLEVAEELGADGKKKYGNETQRKAALDLVFRSDAEADGLRLQIMEAEAATLRHDVETKVKEAELKIKWAYVHMIEARLRAFGSIF